MAPANKDLLCFDWGSILKTSMTHSPWLYQILAVSLKSNNPRKNLQPIITMIISLLTYFRNPAVNTLQKIVSVILYSGHCSKQVFNRLNKLHLCTSHRTLHRLLKNLGENFDNKVLQWTSSLCEKLNEKQVSICMAPQCLIDYINTA
jgi:hypothetical protein